MIKKLKEKILAYALKNSIEHEGGAKSGPILNSLFHEGLEKKEAKQTIFLIQEAIKKINSMSLDEQKKEFSKFEKEISHRTEREGLPELPNAKKGVVMRFAPAASGQLHIGHILTGLPSSIYVEKYGGKFYVRIEDTNPEKTDIEAYSGFKRDLGWLFGNISEYIIQSERLKIYYKYAEELIKKKSAYVCNCNPENFKKLIISGKECPCRKLSAEENLKRWKKMLDKKGYQPGEAVLRFKSDLKNPNPALRDFPLARINTHKHPRQGLKYRVWPLMHLAVPIDDIEFKMSHIIRGKDHKDNAERQKMIYKSLGFEKKFPYNLFIGRIKFSDVVLSKRKIKAAIEAGEFESWGDIRLPTILSLRKRGYQPEAFKKFAIQRGISEVDKVITQKDFFEIINNFNREILKSKTRKADFKANEKKANAIILMPDNTKIYGKLEIIPEKDEIIYFNQIGYCKFNNIENKKFIFYFAHK